MGFSNKMMATAKTMLKSTISQSILLLLNDEHVVVEELLKLLVDKID